MENTVSESCFGRGEIAAYVDGEMPSGREWELECHLEGCEACRRTLTEQRRFLAALSAALGGFALEVPAGYAKQLADRARKSVSIKRRFQFLIRSAW